MPSRITGFHADDEGHWVAELHCGHTQHMRHQPPWQMRPWVATAEGRASFIGAAIPCRPCDVDIEALHHIRRRIEQAENAGDVAYWGELVDEDVVAIVPDYPVQVGKAATTGFVTGVTRFMQENLVRHITYRSDEVQIVSGLGFDRGTFEFSVAWKKPDAETEIVRGKYFWVYRHGEAGWKLWRWVATTDEQDDDHGQHPDAT